MLVKLVQHPRRVEAWRSPVGLQAALPLQPQMVTGQRPLGTQAEVGVGIMAPRSIIRKETVQMMTELEKAWHEGMRAMSVHDPEGVVSHVTDDYIYEDVPMSMVLHGKDELKSYAKDTFSAFPDLKLESKSFFFSGNRAGGEWVMTGTFLGEMRSLGLKPTGKTFCVRGASILEVRGGKLASESLYYDGAPMMRALGLIPST